MSRSFKGAEIRSFTSPEVDNVSAGQWRPKKASEVYYLVEMAIGSIGEPGADLFSVVIATPEALSARKGAESIVISDRAMIVVSRFSWPDVERALRSIVSSCSLNSWNETVLRLQRFFQWEYEDFRREPERAKPRSRPRQ